LSSKQQQFAGFFFLAWLTLQLWRWRRFIPPKPQVIQELYSIINQKTVCSMATALRHSGPIMNRFWSKLKWISCHWRAQNSSTPRYIITDLQKIVIQL
jgi:hypothetical protein